MDIMDTIDKIGETLTSASKDIAKKAKDLVDVNTVRTAMNDQKRIICKAYERIGEQYYKEHVEAGAHEYEVEFEIIGEATAKLKELSEQLRVLKKINVCTECGATVSMDAVFCSKCGVRLKHEEPVHATEEEPMQEVVPETEVEEDVVVEEAEAEGFDPAVEPAADELDQMEPLDEEKTEE